MIERIVNPNSEPDKAKEEELDTTLRPKDFSGYIGQGRIKQNLLLAIKAAKKRGEVLEHILLHGPPGLGKTTLANVIAREMNTNLHTTSGPAISRAADLASILTSLQDDDVLFIDEIHRLNRQVEEILYSAMEDFKIDIMLGKGPSAKSMRLDVPKFTLIGATTRAGALAGPLRDRFGHIYRLDFYSPNEIEEIINRSAKILKTKIIPAATGLIARRSRLTPRIANRMLKRVRDYADVNSDGIVDEKIALTAMDMLQIDELGLDNVDRRLLEAIIENHRGGPVGVETLAALLADERTTIEDYFEPYLMQIGMLERTPRGRKATAKAYKHLKKERAKDKTQTKLV